MRTSGKQITVGLVDDHQVLIEGLKLLLETAPMIKVSWVAASGKEALDKLTRDMPDVLLIDVEMPEMDGIQLCRLIRKQADRVQMIALTMLTERSLIKQMIEAGANGYVLKNIGPEELITAIERVASGKTYYSPEIADVLVRGNMRSPKEKSGILPRLSAREKQIVRLILEERTSQEIAETLSISQNTVETHRRNIMHKLNVRNAAGIVRTVIERGLLPDIGK